MSLKSTVMNSSSYIGFPADSVCVFAGNALIHFPRLHMVFYEHKLWSVINVLLWMAISPTQNDNQPISPYAGFAIRFCCTVRGFTRKRNECSPSHYYKRIINCS